MQKIAIKVIKRKDIAEKLRVAAETVKVLTKPDHKIEMEVNGWIFELKENKTREKALSKDKILSWEHLTKTIEDAGG